MNQYMLFYCYLPFLKNLTLVLFSVFYIYHAIKKVLNFFSRAVTTSSTTNDNAVANPTIKPTVSIETTAATTLGTADTFNTSHDQQNNKDNSSIPATKTNLTQTEINYGSLRHSINSIKSWIELSGSNKLLSLHSPLLPLQNETMLARHVLTELFTIDRSSRLKPMLEYIYDKNTKDEDSFTLATALATLMVKSLKITDDTTVKEDRSYPLSGVVLPLLTNAIRACSDTFVCDFILYAITDSSTMTVVLDQDLDDQDIISNNMINNNNNRQKRSNSDIIDKFMNSDFFTPLPKYHDSFYTKISQKFIGSSLLEKDTQLMMFDRLAKKMLRDINHIQVQLWVKDLVSHISSNSSTHRDNPSTSGSSNSRSTLVSSTDGTASTKENSKGKSPIAAANNDPLKFDDAKCDKVNYDDEALLEYKNRKSGPAYATFEDNIIQLRKNYANIQSEIEDLVSHENIRLFNQIHALSKMGRTLSGVGKRIRQLEKAFHALVTHFTQYQDFIIEYEKGFACYQMANLVELYLNDAQSYYGFLSVKFRTTSQQVDMNMVEHLKKLIDKAAFMAYSLRTNYLMFVAHDLDYKKAEHRDRINTIYNACFIFNRQYFEEFQGKESLINRISPDKKKMENKPNTAAQDNKTTVAQQDSTDAVTNDQPVPHHQQRL